MSLVTLRDLRKSYGAGAQTVEVLHGVDLEIAQGEFLALMGPSGSGKSTLLNIIAGLDKPTSGEVHVAGAPLSTMGATQLAHWRASQIGFVFQLYHLMPALTAAQNVEVPLLLTTLSSAQRKQHVQIALDVVGLSQRVHHKPSQLSGGQQQRVAIARAIVTDPPLLVCDEPTGDLDRASADDVLDLLVALSREQGKTIVMVTHDPLAAARATRQLHLDKGRAIHTSDPH
ncbi:ABC transporter ATP-binding protein [Xanthomonas maliensis]|uniref:ABC transporter ATP-binding protein n=1 Tax=Xanthomonas maliensis TaxID=1321368 RepID=UPI00039EAF40|nr:ABC transporter ATP-binding protein [Xanthomonas maliensis]KAB7766670.1 ABC transporter ATP-binding protein [Xanthomonas maliensis]